MPIAKRNGRRLKTIPHQITKEELTKMLEKRNYQYGELSNKYASLKWKLERIEKIVNEEVFELK